MVEAQESRPAQLRLEIPGYELLGKIGEGGMGQVLRATQLSLQRTVAVKFLKSVGGETAALTRFRREARLSGALAHPCIVATYDFGQVGKHYYLVMEYVDGSTLRSRMPAGQPMPVEQAAPILDAIARALEYIHQEGILHLDLKPENVLCTAGGAIKITDFGLASPGSYSRTLPETERSAGTVDYCSPEQRHGLPVDRRTDVFALATLAYELLTGDLPGRVYVPASERNPRLPRAVNDVLRRGLARDPDERYRQVDDFRRDLNRVLKRSKRRPLFWPVLTTAVLCLALLLILPRLEGVRQSNDVLPAAPPAAPVFWAPAFEAADDLLYPSNRLGITGIFVLRPEGGAAISCCRGDQRSLFPACAPDGKFIAFTHIHEGREDIFVMDANDNVRQLTRDSGSNRAPCWSPDGKRIVFASDRDGNFNIYVMNADGSEPTNLTNNPGFAGDPAWSPDGGKIAFASRRDEQEGCHLYVMDADGQNQRMLTPHDNTFGYVYPAWSPDSTRIAYGDGVESAIEIFLCDLDGGEPRALTVLGGINGVPAWSRDGKKIAFVHFERDDESASLYLMDADGSHVQTLLEHAGPAEGGRPAWKPR